MYVKQNLHHFLDISLSLLQSHTFNDDLVEGSVGSLLCRWSSGECNKGTLLLGHNMNTSDLAKLIEVVSTKRILKKILSVFAQDRTGDLVRVRHT